ncbi:hypothetical protein, partial [Anaerotruncus massiliensis (ex Togo et al. 2019)]|uniref:hypothetical protein n=1 Tax=Anaerotruncus massiliensis (ex Togo et al. 2019) TaxID=1673720 RepID=UPI0027B980CF
FFAFHAADAQKPPLLSQREFCPLEAPTGIGPVNVGFADFLLSIPRMRKNPRCFRSGGFVLWRRRPESDR